MGMMLPGGYGGPPDFTNTLFWMLFLLVILTSQRPLPWKAMVRLPTTVPSTEHVTVALPSESRSRLVRELPSEFVKSSSTPTVPPSAENVTWRPPTGSSVEVVRLTPTETAVPVAAV